MACASESRAWLNPQESDSETERYLLFGAVAGLLESACAYGPVTLLLDDFHWADKQSLTLLMHVIPDRSMARRCCYW